MKAARALAAAGLLVSVSVCGGGDDPVVPDMRIEIVIVGGDNQLAPASGRLPGPLQVVVRAVADQRPEEGRTVRWELAVGAGAALDQATTVTDASGFTSVGATLGSALGEYRMRASVAGQEDVFTEFEANAVLPPQLGPVPASATAGDVIELQGTNFSPTPRHNAVLFSGVPGRVLSSETTRLTVEVPPCLPTRSVDIVVRLGEAGSAPRTMDVIGTQTEPALGVGEDTLLSGSDGFLCVGLGAGGPPTGYLAVVQSANQVGAARFDFQVLGLVGAPATALAVRDTNGTTAAFGSAGSSGGPGQTRYEWERYVRGLEAQALARAPVAPAPARVAARMPEVGERREFDVLTTGGAFAKVTGEVRFVSARAALYVDVSVLADLPDDLVARLAGLFDDPTFPVMTESYGQPSDVDGNGQVIILFTPIVNGLTPRGALGFAAGFFFGLDLLVDQPNSNKGEIFYLMVPDPGGQFSDPRSLADVERVLPAILAHEFQHMIHFNERILKLGAERNDALWLSEGLAHAAEDVVGEHFAAQGDPVTAFLFQAENFGRAGLFLEGPSNSSLIVGAGQADLEERGAAWLFVRYLQERFGGVAVLRSVTQSTRSGIGNVTAVTGEQWAQLLADWGGAVGVEGRPDAQRALVRPELQYPELDLVEAVQKVRALFPLVPVHRGGTDFLTGGRLWSSSGAYFIIEPSASGLALAVVGAGGAPPSEEASLQMKLVRLF